MAYAVSGHDTPTIIRLRDGSLAAVFKITETDVLKVSECALDLSALAKADKDAGLEPRAYAIWYRDSYLSVGGGAATINPTFGRASGWTTGTPDEVAAGPGAAAHSRSSTDTRFVLFSGQSLRMRSAPNADNAGTIITELVVSMR